MEEVSKRGQLKFNVGRNDCLQKYEKPSNDALKA